MRIAAFSRCLELSAETLATPPTRVGGVTSSRERPCGALTSVDILERTSPT
jgi:hypothetical protein